MSGIYGTCDWGGCNQPADYIRDGLPVCADCLTKPEFVQEAKTLDDIGRRTRPFQIPAKMIEQSNTGGLGHAANLHAEAFAKLFQPESE